ncbi:uncharacterized protein ATC70_010499 [Mucor velutinosus]|uniref:Glucose-induced degradation protein 4 homolog n=1 Tax=Mucor velutinosus TaxID=708070 RepID=A0AAN7DFE6_9FUNG|nr:hypothetical protein ATC70_010499 [Mucor velutinosus]
MPIPSIVSSSSSNATPLPVVTITNPSLDEIVLQEDSKCKQQPTIKSEASTVSSNSMETEVSYNTKQHVKSCHKINKAVVLLHARREEDDKVANINEDRLRPVCVGGLYAGSVFRGTQKCGTASYEVNVELLHVDMKESNLCGYLKIKGLTSEFPELTTFFQAEIIGPKYSFHTRKWQADQQSDLLHWKKFPSFKPYVDTFNRDGFNYDYKANDDFIYMRWKETFLVPNHHVSAIDGASFAGFYYICYQRSTNSIRGFYFFRHHKDWFQELNLDHTPANAFGSFEFR